MLSLPRWSQLLKSSGVIGTTLYTRMLTSSVMMMKLVPHLGWNLVIGRTFSTVRGFPAS